MANCAMTAVLARSRVDGLPFAVLLVLAFHVNEERALAGEPWDAWPGIDYLAERFKRRPRTIERALAQLEAEGEVVKAGRRGSSRGAVVWRITLDRARPDKDDGAGEGLDPTKMTGRGKARPDKDDGAGDIRPDRSDGSGEVSPRHSRRPLSIGEQEEARERLLRSLPNPEPVLAPLRDLAAEKQAALDFRALDRALREFPDCDPAVEAERFRDWYRTKGREVELQSIVPAFRKWLGKAPRVKPQRRRDIESGKQDGTGDSVYGRHVTRSGAPEFEQ